MPKLSIITVTYNAANDLEKTLSSVFSQTYNDYEIIIIDGLSSDRTLDIIRLNSAKISYWVSEKDNGIYDAMNKAITIAKGEYIQFLNAGDCYHSDDVLKDVFSEVVEKPTVIYGDIDVLHTDKSVTRQVAKEFIFENLLREGTGVLCHQAMFVERVSAPMYNPKYKFKGELNWYFDLVELTDFSYQHIQTTIVTYALGGFGYQYFIRNRLDWLRVIFDRYGLVSIYKSRIVVFLLKNSLSRYPFLRKVTNIICFPMKLYKN